MTGLFGGAPEPTPVVQAKSPIVDSLPTPKPVKQDDPAAAEKARLERKRLRGQRGRASTVLTSGTGASGEANTASAVLLG